MKNIQYPLIFIFILLLSFFGQPRIQSQNKLDSIPSIAINFFDTSFGNGTKDLIIDNKQMIDSGNYEFRSIIIENGGSLSNFDSAKQSGMILRAKEKIEIKNGAIIDVSGLGGFGINKNTNSISQGRGQNFEYAGGGGSFGGGGGIGSCTEKAITKKYGTLDDSLALGAGGGIGIKNNDGNGGNGGGYLKLIAPEIIIDGQILANGSNGLSTGGGGSGGKIVLYGSKISINGAVNANGGIGGNSQIQGAGGGGGGWILLNHRFIGNGILNVSGGSGGQALDIYTGCDGQKGYDGYIYISL